MFHSNSVCSDNFFKQTCRKRDGKGVKASKPSIQLETLGFVVSTAARILPSCASRKSDVTTIYKNDPQKIDTLRFLSNNLLGQCPNFKLFGNLHIHIVGKLKFIFFRVHCLSETTSQQSVTRKETKKPWCYSWMVLRASLLLDKGCFVLH